MQNVSHIVRNSAFLDHGQYWEVGLQVLDFFLKQVAGESSLRTTAVNGLLDIAVWVLDVLAAASMGIGFIFLLLSFITSIN